MTTMSKLWQHNTNQSTWFFHQDVKPEFEELPGFNSNVREFNHHSNFQFSENIFLPIICQSKKSVNSAFFSTEAYTGCLLKILQVNQVSIWYSVSTLDASRYCNGMVPDGWLGALLAPLQPRAGTLYGHQSLWALLPSGPRILEGSLLGWYALIQRRAMPMILRLSG